MTTKLIEDDFFEVNSKTIQETTSVLNVTATSSAQINLPTLSTFGGFIQNFSTMLGTFGAAVNTTTNWQLNILKVGTQCFLTITNLTLLTPIVITAVPQSLISFGNASTHPTPIPAGFLPAQNVTSPIFVQAVIGGTTYQLFFLLVGTTTGALNVVQGGLFINNSIAPTTPSNNNGTQFTSLTSTYDIRSGFLSYNTAS